MKKPMLIFLAPIISSACASTIFQIEMHIYGVQEPGGNNNYTFTGLLVVDETTQTDLQSLLPTESNNLESFNSVEVFPLESLSLTGASLSQTWNAAELQPYFVGLVAPSLMSGFTYIVELPFPAGLLNSVEPYMGAALGYTATGGPDTGDIDVTDLNFVGFDNSFVLEGNNDFTTERNSALGFSAGGAAVSLTQVVPEPSSSMALILSLGLFLSRSRIR